MKKFISKFKAWEKAGCSETVKEFHLFKRYAKYIHQFVMLPISLNTLINVRGAKSQSTVNWQNESIKFNAMWRTLRQFSQKTLIR